MTQTAQTVTLERIVASAAQTLRDPQPFHADALAGEAQRGHGHPRIVSPRSLAQGNTGAALLYAALATADAQYRRAAFEHIGAALRADASDLSLYEGWAGIYAVLVYASEAGKYYRDAIAGVGEKLRAAAAARYRARTIVAVDDFDVVSGAAGIALALQANTPPELLDLLASLAPDPAVWKLPMPGAPALGAVNNLGVAHGIAGVLAALCCASRPQDYRAAKIAFADYLIAHAAVADGAPAWASAAGAPVGIPLLWHWCYGTAGVASVLGLAGDHLGVERYVREAQRAMNGLAERVVRSDGAREALPLADYGVCHGLAGVTLMLDRFALRHPAPVLADAVTRCTAEMVAAYDPGARFGYRAADYPHGEVDANGFLTGFAGIALVLATLQGAIDDRWVRVLGIAPAGGDPPDIPCLRLS